MRGATRRVANALVVVVLAGTGLALAVSVVPRLFGYGSIVVAGGSMQPTLRVGSLLIAQPIPASEVRVGDVILVREGEQGGRALPKIHRVVWVAREGDRTLVRTKGDANQTPDPLTYVLPDRVLSPVWSIPFAGYMVAFVKTLLGWALLVALPAVYLSFVTLRDVWRKDVEAGPQRLPVSHVGEPA